MGDAEVTFKDETDEIIKLPAAKLPELPKVEGNSFFFQALVMLDCLIPNRFFEAGGGFKHLQQMKLDGP